MLEKIALRSWMERYLERFWANSAEAKRMLEAAKGFAREIREVPGYGKVVFQRGRPTGIKFLGKSEKEIQEIIEKSRPVKSEYIEMFSPEEYTKRRAEALLEAAKKKGFTIHTYKDFGSPMTVRPLKAIYLPEKPLPSIAAHEALEAVVKPVDSIKSAILSKKPTFGQLWGHLHPTIPVQDMRLAPLMDEVNRDAILNLRAASGELSHFEKLVGKKGKVPVKKYYERATKSYGKRILKDERFNRLDQQTLARLTGIYGQGSPQQIMKKSLPKVIRSKVKRLLRLEKEPALELYTPKVVKRAQPLNWRMRSIADILQRLQ